MKDNQVYVHGYWKDEPEYLVGVIVCLDSNNGEENDEVFFYMDGETIGVGDTIAGDFVVTEIEG